MTYSRPLMLRVEKAVGVASGTRTACASIDSIRIVLPSSHLRPGCASEVAEMVNSLCDSAAACYDRTMEREPAVAVRRAVALLLTLGGDEALAAGGRGVKRLTPRPPPSNSSS